ncbi:EAL domain-containing protein [Comamonas sp.]|uniref:EAL domain-containing protein n=1 Tax=Comamonas sp. TaxID=34028 RepID=UPI0012D25C9D|nr:EAL domain-containing protein [Comamonas sp.]MPS92080.1 EAL domain-containing protein [Comamonas sp.]
MKDVFAKSVEVATMPCTSRLVDRICDGVLAREFSVAFQPIVDVDSGRTVGAEALLRWQHPEFGQLLPGTFAKALLAPEAAWATTAFVIDEVCRQLNASLATASTSFPEGGARLQFVSFNVLPSQLQGTRLETLIREALSKHRVRPSLILIELLECESIADQAKLQQDIERLRKLGVRVAIDDFGSGSWTLCDLANLKVDVVKLSGKLVKRAPLDARRWLILGGMIGLLSDLGFATVVEGIESTDQRAWIETQRPVMAQGYGYARPQPCLRSALRTDESLRRIASSATPPATHAMVPIEKLCNVL